MSLELTPEEIAALRQAAFVAKRVPQLGKEIDLDKLQSADKKLARSGPGRRCKHCRERGTRRASGHCDRCTTYQRKYGRLPSEETLVKSARRRAATRRGRLRK